MLHHEAAGDGPPVLLIHAGVADGRMWEPQWHALAAEHRVIRCDLYGFGQSPMPAEDFVLADAVAEVVQALGVEQTQVVGASFGGLVALELATLHPHLVSRLVLLSPAFGDHPPTPDFEEFDAEESRLVEAGDLDAAVELNVSTWLGPEASEQTAEVVREMQRRAFELQLEASADAREVELFPEDIDAPTLIVNGGYDLEFFRVVGQHLATRMPNAEHVVLDWAGHLPSLERPAEMTQMLRASLAR